MEECQITGAVHGKTGVLVKVFIDGSVFAVSDVYDWIETGDCTFFTLKNGKKTIVRTGVSPTGRKYITTHPDGVTENNLEELKSFKLSKFLLLTFLYLCSTFYYIFSIHCNLTESLMI
ncbi:MAG: DUF3892 domain-containing protein [Thermodesulfobacteriota bacterium]